MERNIDDIDGDGETELLGLLWPQLGGKVFAPAFSDAHLNACITDVHDYHSMEGYVNGYHHAAKMLYESITAGSLYDWLIYPLAFLWRQYAELRIKHIISLGRELEGGEGGFPMHHRINDLWLLARPHIVPLLPADGRDRPALAAVDDAMRELALIDPAGVDFRYATTATGDKTLTNIPRLVNARNMHETMDGIANFLNCGASELQQRIACHTEGEWSPSVEDT